MSLEEKLNQFRGGYPSSSFSVGSLMFFGSFSEEYGIKLNKLELEELGLRCKLKMESDFSETTNFVFQALRNLYDNSSLGILINLPTSILDVKCYRDSKSFHEDFVDFYSQKKYKKQLASTDDKSKLRFNQISKGRFREKCLKPIEIYSITEDDLIRLNPDLDPKYFEGFSNVRWRKKSIESLVLKESIRQSRILIPNKKDLDKIDINNTNLIGNEELGDSLIRFMGYMLQSGESFHKTMGDINYLINGEDYGILNSHYGHHFIDLAADLILTDSGGGTFVMSDPDLYKKLDSMYDWGISNYTQIQYEDNLATYSKDRSVSASFLSLLEGNYFEMRLRHPWVDIKADYGEWAHDDYKKSEFNDYMVKYKSSSYLRKGFKKLSTMFKINPKEVLKI